jgi:hypothetical protein
MRRSVDWERGSGEGHPTNAPSQAIVNRLEDFQEVLLMQRQHARQMFAALKQQQRPPIYVAWTSDPVESYSPVQTIVYMIQAIPQRKISKPSRSRTHGPSKF